MALLSEAHIVESGLEAHVDEDIGDQPASVS